MSLLIAVIDQVATATGLVKGVSLFAGRLPEAPDTAVAVWEYEGQPAEYVYGSTVLDQPRMQLLSRGPKAGGYATARQNAVTAATSLDVAEVSWGGYQVHRCQPLYTVATLGPDEADRPLFSVRFELMVTRA